MRRVLRGRLKRLDDHLLDLSVGDLPWLPGPRLIGQPVQTMLGEPVTPPPRGRNVDPETLSDLGGLEALSGGQHDPRSLRQRLRARTPPRPRLQLLALDRAELDDNR